MNPFRKTNETISRGPVNLSDQSVSPLQSGLERLPNQLIADNRDAIGEGGGVGHKSSASDDYPILPVQSVHRALIVRDTEQLGSIPH